MDIKPVLPEKLVVGMISALEEFFERASAKLVQVLGNMDFTGPVLPFDYTDYYQKEFGRGLKRKFIAFENLVPPERLAGLKGLTNRLEKEFALKEPETALKRRINLDPGLLSAGKFVLATTKDQQHRIYLAEGIYAEVTLRYHQRTFRPNDWTYPDYRSPEYIGIFNQIRDLYRQQLKDREWICA